MSEDVGTLKTMVERHILEQYPDAMLSVSVDWRSIATISGECTSYQQLVDIGHSVAKLPEIRNVVSEMQVKGMELPHRNYSPLIEQGTEAGELASCDVVIVGLGIVGAACARELARYNLDVIAIDIAEDIATGASKANNGGVHHAGGVKPGTLKAKLSVQGNRMWDRLSEELGFDFDRCGDLLYIEDPDDMDELADEFKTAVRNGDYKPKLIDGEQCFEIEPKLAKYGRKPVMGLWLPSQGRVHTYEVAVALAENAAQNGVRIMLETAACDVITTPSEHPKHEGECEVVGVLTNRGLIHCRYIVNAAGLYSDDLSAMSGDKSFSIHGRRGTIAIVDKAKKPMFDHLTGRMNPEKKQGRDPNSKGGGMEFTPSKNILIGPSAQEVPDKEDTRTTREDLNWIWQINENPDVSQADIIRVFSGVRPADFSEDFQVNMSEICHRFVNAGAIQSPGVGSSPAIAVLVSKIILDDAAQSGQHIENNDNFNPYRKRPVRFRELSHEEQDALVAKRPKYGRIVCRCEQITEGEVVDALHSPVVPRSIDGIKRRCRCGMGRCQGGFCQERVLEIIARELGEKWCEVPLHGPGSEVLRQDTRPHAYTPAPNQCECEGITQ